MENKQRIIVISTGGTIEKTYSELDGSLKNREMVIKRNIIKRLRYPHCHFSLKAIMSKDSLEMLDDDRRIVCEEVENELAHKSPIIILHGTDTMDQTARLLFEKIKNTSRPIVMTGAMRPLGFVDSDASQNFIESVMAAQTLPPGIYLSFHGQVYEAPNFKKDRRRRTFVSSRS